MVILINLSYRPCPYSYLLVGVVGSSSKGGKVGSLIKMECHTSAKIPKRGEEYQSQGSNSRDRAVHLVTELCCPYLGVAIVKH